MKIKNILTCTLIASLVLVSTNLFGTKANKVHAAWRCHSRLHNTSSSDGTVYSGTITFNGDDLDYIYYNANLFGTKAIAHKGAQTGNHCCGVSNNGNTKWSDESWEPVLESDRVSNGNVTVMGMHQV